MLNNVLISAVIDYATNQAPTVFSYLERQGLETAMQAALDAVILDKLTLSSAQPDYEAILFRFVQAVQNDRVWKDIVQVGTGQTLLRNISSAFSQNNYAVLRALQEAHLHTAQSRSAIYAGSNQLGVSIRRRVPAQIRVRLTIPEHFGTFSIPRFTQFVILSTPYFNREPLLFTEFELFKDVQLTQGTIQKQEGSAAGIPYETFELGYENYLVSNDDLYVFVNDIEYRSNDELGLRPWSANKNETVYFAKTLETGNVEVKFGNTVFGKQLAYNDKLRFVWAETQGGDTPVIPSNTGFLFEGLSLNVSGNTLTQSFGGDNELPLEHYKNFAPHIRAGNGNGVRRADMKTLALNYPTVVDALFQGQAELAPDKRNWMNVVSATILTRTGMPFSPIEWEAFQAYMEENSVESFDFVRFDPLIILVDVSVQIFCHPRSVLSNIKTRAEAVIRQRFAPKQGSIDHSFFDSDVVDAVRNDPELSDFVEYFDNIVFSYPPVVEQSIPEGQGIQGDKVIAKSRSAIVLSSVFVDPRYTVRQTYQGRIDNFGDQ